MTSIAPTAPTGSVRLTENHCIELVTDPDGTRLVLRNDILRAGAQLAELPILPEHAGALATRLTATFEYATAAEFTDYGFDVDPKDDGFVAHIAAGPYQIGFDSVEQYVEVELVPGDCRGSISFDVFVVPEIAAMVRSGDPQPDPIRVGVIQPGDRGLMRGALTVDVWPAYNDEPDLVHLEGVPDALTLDQAARMADLLGAAHSRALRGDMVPETRAELLAGIAELGTDIATDVFDFGQAAYDAVTTERLQLIREWLAELHEAADHARG